MALTASAAELTYAKGNETAAADYEWCIHYRAAAAIRTKSELYFVLFSAQILRHYFFRFANYRSSGAKACREASASEKFNLAAACTLYAVSRFPFRSDLGAFFSKSLSVASIKGS